MKQHPICIITARAGSKGLPNKNMLYLMGKPMLIHSIDVAMASGKFRPQDIYVSTDSQQYKEIIEAMRPVNVILRPAHLATDTATSLDVLKYFLQDFDDEQLFMLLQPTSPLRTAEDINNAFDLYMNSEGCTSVVSFSESEKSTNLFTTIDDKGCPVDMFGVDTNYRRQAQETIYYSNGNIYLVKKKDYLAYDSFFTEGTRALITPHESSFDVDDLTTFKSVLGQIYFNYQWRDQRYRELQSQQFLNYNEHDLHSQVFLTDQRLSFLQHEECTNVTVQGLTAHLTAEYLEQLLSNQSQVKHIQILLGINDLICGETVNSLKQSMLTIINICQQYNISLTINAIIYTLFRMELNNQLIREANDMLRQLAIDYNCQWMDLNDTLSKNNDLLLMYTSDGVEFNEEGKGKIITCLFE